MFDVIVAGAGPAGSVAAAILARRGCRVLLLDRAAFPRPKPCGDYLNPGCVTVLRRTGAWSAVAGAVAPLAGMRLVAADGTPASATFSEGTAYALSRAVLDDLLVARAAGTGASVIEHAFVAAVDREDATVRLAVERGPGRARLEHHRAAVVIGADGLRSRVALTTRAGSPPRQGRFTVGGYLEGLAPDAVDAERRPFAELHLGRSQYCGIAYLPDGRANVTIAVPPHELRSWRGSLEARYWIALRAFPGLRDRVARAALVGELRAYGPLGFASRRAAGPGVLLAGDAAGFIDPMTGQGVYLALRGGELAADAAARALDGDGPALRAVAEYRRAHRRAFGGASLVARILHRVAFRPRLAAHAVRRMAGRPDLGTRFIDAIGNVRPAASLFRPGFLAALLDV